MKSITRHEAAVSERKPVLFDEDYHAHIAKLDRMLERERHEVWKLRAQLEDMTCAYEICRGLVK